MERAMGIEQRFLFINLQKHNLYSRNIIKKPEKRLP